tara:strand:+ start:1001 stop:1270 length:270 start_codon:yes stop_codon:yes gene_type:complete
MKKKQDSYINILNSLKDHILENYPSEFDNKSLPTNKSLVELEVLDSYSVVQLVLFIEQNWKIQILDEEITKEKMGSIEKMTNLILEKIS